VNTHAGTAAAYTLVVVLSIELAVWESFLTGARPFGTALPVSAALTVVGNVVLSVAGARLLRRRLGAIIPSLLWLGIALTLGGTGPGGDRVVLQDGRGLSFLLLGAVAAAVVVGAIDDGRRVRATPEPSGSR
jgi:hypothetical protein